MPSGATDIFGVDTGVINFYKLFQNLHNLHNYHHAHIGHQVGDVPLALRTEGISHWKSNHKQTCLLVPQEEMLCCRTRRHVFLLNSGMRLRVEQEDMSSRRRNIFLSIKTESRLVQQEVMPHCQCKKTYLLAQKAHEDLFSR